MGFDLILGRTAIRRHGLLVNPGRTLLAGDPVILPAKKRRYTIERPTQTL